MGNFESFERLKNIKLLLKTLSLEPKIENNNLRISPLSKSAILAESHGEVRNPETINYRTLRPEKDGLFCEKIFGPERDYECGCGKYLGKEYKGTICDRCGVKVTTSKVRGERMGHIKLTTSVVHPYFRGHLADILGIPEEEFNNVIYYYHENSNIRDIQNLKDKISKESKESNMILDSILVLPPDKRPIFYLETGAFASSDVNDSYRRVINRNLRLKKLKELDAPKPIIRSELRMLQQTIDTLFFNEQATHPVLGANDKPLVSLTGSLINELKNFWKNTCDYSGKAVVVSNPKLEKNQCELPERVLIELYQPLIIHYLKKAGVADTIVGARRAIEKKKEPAVKQALDKAILSRPIVVTYSSKATAFYPKIGEIDALSLTPGACRNLDLKMNGKEISFHLPLSELAVKEAQSLVGKYIEGNGKVKSTFSSLIKDDSIGPLINVVVEEKALPLSELEKNLILTD